MSENRYDYVAVFASSVYFGFFMGGGRTGASRREIKSPKALDASGLGERRSPLPLERFLGSGREDKSLGNISRGDPHRTTLHTNYGGRLAFTRAELLAAYVVGFRHFGIAVIISLRCWTRRSSETRSPENVDTDPERKNGQPGPS